MGRPKALLPVGRDTFATRLVRTLRSAGIDPVLVVAAPETAAAIAASIADEARTIVNPHPDRGQLSSLQTGLSVLGDRAGAVLVTPVDLPLVRRASVASLLQAWRASGALVVRPVSRGRRGHPVLIAPPVVRELLAAAADRTARDVMQAFAADTLDVPVEDEGAFADIDTPEEYLEVLDALEVEKWKSRS